MKRLILPSIVLLLTASSVWAQIVTTDPSVPVVDRPVTVYFDATQGTAGLKDYTGDVYAHTGVLTDASTSGSDWKHVKTAWGENTPETKMTRISANLYKLEIGPTIREYYQVPANETITHMAFVFRSDFPYSGTSYYEGKETGGQDIFVEVFDLGLNVTFIQPQSQRFVILQVGDTLQVEAGATLADSVSLYIDDDFLKKGADTTGVSDTLVAGSTGSYWIRAVARDTSGFVADSFLLYVRPSVNMAGLPDSVEDGIQYHGDTAATLVLYAPGKDHVFVLGDFNHWLPGNEGFMNKTPDGERFWLRLDGLISGKEYRYQYLVDDTLTVADPYTEKILDPWNDPGIAPETYPGLLNYPTDTTSGIVSVLLPGEPEYAWKNTGFDPPDPQKLVIYELLIRDFVANHDFKTLIDTLDYFSRLGVNAIELMPVNEFEGNESWGYNPSFYFATDKYYGPGRDMKAFVDSCHGRGIAVIIDMVLNHSYGQSPMVQLYLDRNTWQVTPDNPWYNVSSPNPAFSWGYDFNHESPATQYFVDRVTRYWLEEYQVDGYRFDFTKGFTNTPGDGWARDDARIAILKRMADSIRAVKPNAFLILEHFCDNTEEKILSDYDFLLWGNLNCAFSQAAMGYASGSCGSWDYSWGSYKNRGWTMPGLVAYMESHDEERLMYKTLTYGNSSGAYDSREQTTALNRAAAAATLFFTIPGPKMIWQFGDFGYDVSIDQPCRVCNKPIHWDYEQEPQRLRLHQIYSALIHLKKNEQVFNTQDFSVYASDPVKYNVLNHTDMHLVSMANFDVTVQNEVINWPATGTWYEYFSGDSISVGNLDDQITLNPGEYRIYTDHKLTPPAITAGTNAKKPFLKAGNIKVLPNPAQSQFRVSFVADRPGLAELHILDLSGKLILNKKIDISVGENLIRFTETGLQPGFYLINLKMPGMFMNSRFVIVK